MKKFLSLLTLLCLAVTGVWADDVIFSATAAGSGNISIPASTSDSELTSSEATITGGKMYVFNGQSSAKDLISNQGPSGKKKQAFTITNNNTYFKVSLNKALEVGDVISVDFYATGTRGLWFSTGDRPDAAPTASISHASNNDWISRTYTVAENDGICGETDFFIYRNSSTTYFTNFIITRPVVDTRTAVTLSFPNATEAATLGGSFTAPTLTVNPTAAASEVAYSSSNTSVATVDASTGAVTLKAGGSTTITAKIENSTTYKDATASYTLNVTDPDIKNVTATWAFSTGQPGQTAVIDVDNVFSLNSVSVAKLSYIGVASDQDITGTKMQPTVNVSDDKSEYVKFILTPKKGMTFVPTKIEFDAMRWGTDGNNKLHYYAECGETSQELGNINPNRNGKGKGWSHCSHNISGISATKDNPFALALYVYGLATDKQISFANVVITGTYSGTPEDETTFTVSTSVTPDGAGTITQNPAGSSFAEGTAISFSATANKGYAFLNKWTVNSNEEEGETYNIASLAENTTVVAQFKKLYTVSYNKTAEGVLVGTCNEVLGEEYANASNKWTAPINQYMTKAGYTFVNWKDADNNEYTPGTEYELTKDITITPQFVENTQSLAMRTEAIEVTWNFRNSSVYFNSQGNTQYYVKQATINNETVDIPMYCNTTSGKLNNTNRTDGWIQANGGTVLTIPAVKGMTVAFGKTRYEFGRSDKTATTVGGEEPSSKSGDSEYNYSASFTYNGTAETVDIAIGSDISYMSTITVTYPKNATFVDVSDAGYRTFASSSALDFTDGVEGLTAYRAVVIGDKVSFVAINGPVPAKEGMLLKAAKGRYYIPLASGTPAEIENEFVGVTSAEEVGSGIFVLYADDTHPIGFYKTSTTFTVSANTAYLPADITTARSFIALDEEATGIAEIEAMKNVGNEKFYNLNGQRVAQPTKGLYIVNGKKVILK